MTALVIGGTGFIGQRLVMALRDRDGESRLLSREPGRVTETHGVVPVSGDLTVPESLQGAAKGVDTVYHLAGFAHAVDSPGGGAESMHQAVTVEGTRALLYAAVHAGVDRFVFASSVKAMGEGGEECLDESAPELPLTAYGRAKLEAERLVLEAGRKYGIHAVVLRLPLVYGPGHKGNIPRMIAAIDRGRFPPLPETGNRRSMVHVDDVVRALLRAAEDPTAKGKVYLVTDGRSYSSAQLYGAIARGLGKRLPRLRVPTSVLVGLGAAGDVVQRLSGRPVPVNSEAVGKLLGSACYDSGRIERELGFRPQRTFFDALPEMIDEYRSLADPGR